MAENLTYRHSSAPRKNVSRAVRIRSHRGLTKSTRNDGIVELGSSQPRSLAAWMLDHGNGYGQPAAAIMSAVLGRTCRGPGRTAAAASFDLKGRGINREYPNIKGKNHD